MPGMSGRELANIVSKLRSGIKVLFMSGYTNDLIAQYGVLEAGTLLLENLSPCIPCSTRSTPLCRRRRGQWQRLSHRFYLVTAKIT
jgi:hypothetical protein